MKKTTQLFLMACVSSALLAGCGTPRQASRQWEYKVVTANMYNGLQPELSKAGVDGWEAVSAVTRGDPSATVILKRPKP